MATKNIREEIICEHAKECKSYSARIGDGRINRCVNCKNNKYVHPEDLKKDYYKPTTSSLIVDVITTTIAVGVIIMITGFAIFA